MIARRGLLTGGAALSVMGMATPSEIRFDVLRNGSKIGHHEVDFQQRDDTLVATTTVEIVYAFGPIVLFRYNHSVRETWSGGTFQTLESETNDDGKRFRVRAVRARAGIDVDSSALPRAVLPPETIPLTHWNILDMQRPLFDPQDGKAIEARATPRGEEMVPLADGKLVRATHYSLAGTVSLDDWYDSARMWTALRSKGTDGSTIDYRRAV